MFLFFFLFFIDPCRCESNSTPKKYDLVVVGGGIVGMATAREIALRHPKMNIAVLEKENHLGMYIHACSVRLHDRCLI